MTTILLVRHGESGANGAGFFAGQVDIPITSRGEAQARAAAKYVAKNYSVDAIYSSDLKRAMATADALSRVVGKEIVPDGNLREIYAGKWQGVTFSALEKDYADTYSVWLSDVGRARPDGGESVKELAGRVYETIEKIARGNDGKTVAVFTHATPLRAFMSVVLTGGTDRMRDIPWVGNASLTKAVYEDGKFAIIDSGVDFYLENLKTTFPPNV